MEGWVGYVEGVGGMSRLARGGGALRWVEGVGRVGCRWGVLGWFRRRSDAWVHVWFFKGGAFVIWWCSSNGLF